MDLFWPLKSSSKRITQKYGDIWSANKLKKHTGVDIAATPGDRVYAAADGVITKIGALDTTGAWAKYAVLEHDTKDYCTSYLHIDPKVVVGQKLKAGDLVGLVANIVGPHCHFNVWKGLHDNTLTQRGALPIVFVAGGDPIFPNSFIDPTTLTYKYVDAVAPTPPTPTPAVPLFQRDIALNDSGPDVKLLQTLLNKDPDTRIAATGVGCPGQETDRFGDLTLKAVQKFQIKYSITTPGGAGYGSVGPKTRTKLQELFGNR